MDLLDGGALVMEKPNASGTARRVFIVHPYVQSYRRGLYKALSDALRDIGLELCVVENESPPSLRERKDTASGAWSRKVPSRWISFLGRDVAIRELSNLQPVRGDLFIVEQALRNLETYPLLLNSQRNGLGVAMWGHGKTYSTYQPKGLRVAKNFLTRQVEWFFAYTYGGARYVNAHGFPAEHTTILNNTIDTQSLSQDLNSVGLNQVQEFNRALGLTPGRTGIFIGGIDRKKGIDFLVAAARRIASDLPGFKLLLGGEGSDLPRVRVAEQSGAPIRSLGRLEGQRKALALQAADILMVPQWIGLVAVDSLVAGRPIVTTWHKSHSPEVEYLVPNRNVIFTNHSVADYSRQVTDLLHQTPRLHYMQLSSREDSALFSIDQTVDRFTGGLAAWMDRRRRHGLL